MTYVVGTAFTDDTLNHGTFELAAPGMIGRVRLAALMSDVAGQQLSAEDLDPDAAVPPDQPDGLQAMLDSYDEHGFHGGNAASLSPTV